MAPVLRRSCQIVWLSHSQCPGGLVCTVSRYVTFRVTEFVLGVWAPADVRIMLWTQNGVLLCLTSRPHSDRPPTCHPISAQLPPILASSRCQLPAAVGGPHVYACVIAPARRQAVTPNSINNSSSTATAAADWFHVDGPIPAVPPALGTTRVLHLWLLQSADCCACLPASQHYAHARWGCGAHACTAFIHLPAPQHTGSRYTVC